MQIPDNENLSLSSVDFNHSNRSDLTLTLSYLL